MKAQQKAVPGKLWTWLAVAAVVLAGSGCRSAPVTGRKQMLLLPETNELSMGATAYQDTVTKEPPSQNAQYVAMVNRVGQRIAAVAGRPDYQWEFRVIAKPEQNAFCLPGGKVAVYEGILPICESEAGLAVVMSHEVAHALARHGGERISQGYAVEAAKQAMAYATQSQDEQRKEMIMKAYGMASQYGVILPYSRKHEAEADHIGLMLMAKAGYDPAEAPRFWQRFAQSHQGSQPMEFFSTHPSDETRAASLLSLLPEAQNLYNASPEKWGRGEMIALAPAAGPATAAAANPVSPAANGATSGGQNSGPASTAPGDVTANPAATSPIAPANSVLPTSVSGATTSPATASTPAIFGPPIR